MKHIALTSIGLLAGLAAATAFLCARPDAAPAVQAVPDAARNIVLAVEPAEFRARASRHAADALRVSVQRGNEDELGWDYVQLRL
jgi:hypothetical protein